MTTISLKAKRIIILLTFALFPGFQQSFAQDLPKIDLLKLNESKPVLSSTGEGVASYKISELYHRGTTKIVPFKPKFKVQLPIGYSLFNDLIYVVQTDVEAVGPTDIELRIPSAETAELFDKLRILYADTDDADLEVPKWIDGTVSQIPTSYQERWLAEGDRGSLRPNFGTRTLHALMEDEPTVFLVAVRDPNLVRDRFTANLKITGSDVKTMEGRTFSRTLKVTNSGPDTANFITVRAHRTFEVVSMKPTVGTCRVTSGEIFCRIPELKADQSVEVEVVEQCPWVSGETSPPEGWKVEREAYVEATEQDPEKEDNETSFVTRVLAGTNRSPVATVTNLRIFQRFRGPSPNIPIRVTASDPDGSIGKVEFFEETKPVGVATLIAKDEYEFTYKGLVYGRHRLQVKVTDNLGRDLTTDVPEFFVNGLAEIEIINPKPGITMAKPDGPIPITIRAHNTSSSVKKVSVYWWDTDATLIGNDLYVYNLPACGRRCSVQASAFDADGIETRSAQVEFILAQPPHVELRWFDGQYSQSFEDKKSFKVEELLLLPGASPEGEGAANVVKLEVFKDGKLFCSQAVNNNIFASAKCQWNGIRPGRYQFQAVATDEDGAVGKSPVITVTITP
jgi:hypothetical protein